MNKPLRVTGACVMGLAVGAGCTKLPQDPPAFDALAFQLEERTNAEQAEVGEMRELPKEFRSPYLDRARQAEVDPADYPPPTTGPSGYPDNVVRLPLQELIHRAVLHNRDIRVAGYQPAIEQTRVVESEARFDPVFFSGIEFRRTEELTANQQIFGTDPFEQEQDTYTLATGIRQDFGTGGRAEVRYETSRNRFRGDSNFEPNPYYENELVLEITQPLLRNFGSEVNRARIEVDRNNQHISLLELRATVEEIVFNIEMTYWQLVQAQRNVEILERLLARTEDTADIVSRRQRQDASAVETSQTVSSIQRRRAALIRAKAQVRDLSDQLKRLINDPSMPVSSGVLILPATDAIQAPFSFDFDEALATALENRLELAQQQLRVDSADIVERVAKNNLLPQLNLVGQISVQGFDDSWGGAFENQADLDQISYGVGLQLEIPIGNRAARAIYTRSRLQRLQAIEQYQNLVSQIALDLKTAQREVQTAWDEMVASREATLAAAEALRLTQERRRLGEPLTPTFVQLELNLQLELAQAEQAEQQAITAYNVAIARFERAKGTLLRYNNVLLAEEQLATVRPER